MFPPFGLVRTKVFVVSHGLAQVRSYTIQDNVNKIVVCHLATDIESIIIFLVLLDDTCLSEITDLVKYPDWLTVISIVLRDGNLTSFKVLYLCL